MNVLSLFDGMSCGQLALKKLGITPDNYFASEIDPSAIQITKKNFPKTLHLGCVKDVSGKRLPKISLILCGSPCQGFSFAGKSLNFEDPRSKLFFEFVRILEETKPKYWLLENVKMKKEYQDTITKILGVEPIEINSALVSAQQRKRIYWTNIPNVTQPKDKKIFFKDVIQDGDSSGVFLSEETVERFIRYKIPIVDKRTEKVRCLSALEYKKNGRQGNYIKVKVGDLWAWSKSTRYPKGQTKFLEERFKLGGKANTLTTGDGCCNFSSKNYVVGRDWILRKLTPLECEKLQTVPDNYTEGVSLTQRYKMLGNGWTVDVIAHILKGIK